MNINKLIQRVDIVQQAKLSALRRRFKVLKGGARPARELRRDGARFYDENNAPIVRVM